MSAVENPIISLVVAVADNGVIGREGGLPWRLKSDLRRFRKLTMGHPMIMGGNTFRSIGRALDGRDSIVLTHGLDRNWNAGCVLMAASWDEAEALAKKCAVKRDVTEIFVIGGASVYELALPHSGRIYLSRVHGSPAGDIHWTGIPANQWQEISSTSVPAGPEDEYPVTHLVLERRHDPKRHIA